MEDRKPFYVVIQDRRESVPVIGARFTEVVVRNHASLNNLDFENSGHTGFASSKELNETKQKLDDTTNLANKSFSSATYDLEYGILTLVDNDGNELKIDLPMEQLVKTGRYDKDATEIVLVLYNGEEIRIPAVELVDIYLGSQGKEINVDVDADNVISAYINEGSIEEDRLSLNVIEKLNNASIVEEDL